MPQEVCCLWEQGVTSQLLLLLLWLLSTATQRSPLAGCAQLCRDVRYAVLDTAALLWFHRRHPQDTETGSLYHVWHNVSGCFTARMT
jgi:hypothetical protein